MVLLAILPWMLKSSFRGTNLTLQRLGQAMLHPITLSLSGVFVAELALHLITPVRIVSQLSVAALSFAVAFCLSALIPSVRKEMLSLKKLSSELRLSSKAGWDAASG